MELANKVLDLRNVNQVLLGEGVETDFEYNADRFRKKYNINEPYIIYAGRKDEAKNIYTLIKYFGEFTRRNPDKNLKLVLIGGGDINIPEDIKDKVVDLGFLDMMPVQVRYVCASRQRMKASLL